MSPDSSVQGMVGFVLSLLKRATGFEREMFIGVVDEEERGAGNGILIVYALNGLVWGTLYGAFGCALDRYRKRMGDWD